MDISTHVQMEVQLLAMREDTTDNTFSLQGSTLVSRLCGAANMTTAYLGKVDSYATLLVAQRSKTSLCVQKVVPEDLSVLHQYSLMWATWLHA